MSTPSNRVGGWAIKGEVWWSRFALPSVQAWSEDKPLHLESRSADKTDADPKAIACYGVWLKAFGQMLLRFVQQRPVSEITCSFLAWLCQQMQQLRVLVLVWDNATWHLSKQVRQWIKDHNAQVKRSGVGVRLIVCRLIAPHSPQQNLIEDIWLATKTWVRRFCGLAQSFARFKWLFEWFVQNTAFDFSKLHMYRRFSKIK